MNHLWIDVKQAFRRIRRRPGMSLLAIAMLGAGIGATTALFTALYSVAIRPLSFHESQDLFTLSENSSNGPTETLGFATIADLRAQAKHSEPGIFGSWLPILSGAGDPSKVEGLKVSGNFFRLLGARPEIGRLITDQDDRPDADRVVLLSYRLWAGRFGSDPGVIGRVLTMDDTPYTVVGVLPSSFEPVFWTNFGKPADLWRPLRYEIDQPWACRTCRHLHAFIRVSSGDTEEMASAELQTLSAAMVATHPKEYSATGFQLEPLLESVSGPVRSVLAILLGAVTLLLGLACVNLASLQLGSLTRRLDELAIRAAVGASRARIVQQHMIESLVLSLSGGILGVAMAFAGTQYLGTLTTTQIPRLGTAGPGLAVLIFALLATIGTALVIGAGPALRASKTIAQVRGDRTAGHRSRQRGQSILVGIEVALAIALLIGAILITRSLDGLLSVDPGFNPKNLLTAEIASSGKSYEELESEVAYFQRILGDVRKSPQVRSAAVASQAPMGGDFDGYGVRAQDRPLANPADAPNADRYSVTPGWLKTMEIPLRRGRDIERTDTAQSEPVVLIDETLAKHYWPGVNPLGRHVQMGADDTPWRTVVGVVGTVHHTKLDSPPHPQIYIPETQWQWAEGRMIIAIRTKGDPVSMVKPLREIVHAIDPTQPLSNIATMEMLLGQSVEKQRFVSRVLTMFGTVALALVAVGIFAVLSMAIGQRSREMAVRMALGASASNIASVILRVGFAPVIFGVAAGIAIASLLGRFLESLLYGVTTSDVSTLVLAAGVVIAATAMACLMPIRRALRIEPARELRA